MHALLRACYKGDQQLLALSSIRLLASAGRRIGAASQRAQPSCKLDVLVQLCHFVLQAAEVERLNGVYSQILQRAGVEVIGAFQWAGCKLCSSSCLCIA